MNILSVGGAAAVAVALLLFFDGGAGILSTIEAVQDLERAEDRAQACESHLDETKAALRFAGEQKFRCTARLADVERWRAEETAKAADEVSKRLLAEGRARDLEIRAAGQIVIGSIAQPARQNLRPRKKRRRSLEWWEF